MSRPWLRGLLYPHRSKTLGFIEKGAKDPEAERRKWFDDVELESSTELSSLGLYVTDIEIKMPAPGSDIDLIALVKCANEPPENRHDQEKSLNMLRAYLEKVKQKQEHEKKEAAEKESQAQDQWRKKDQKRGPFRKKIHSILKEATPLINSAFDFVLKVLYGGMKALEATVFLAAEATFQTHYEVAVKAIMLFITVCSSMKAYESAGKLTDEINSMFQKIDDYGQEMKALQDNIKSIQMTKAINKLFVSIVGFIVACGSYLSYGTLSKMVRFLGGGNDKFDKHLKAIRDGYAEMAGVMTFAQVMVSFSSHDKINRVKDNTVTIMKQLSLLNESLTPDMSQQLRMIYDHSIFQTGLHVQNLRSDIFDGPYEPSDELGFNERERVFVSPKDRWPRHLRGFGAFATSRLATSKGSRPLMWISGDLGRRNVCWVSSFCVDMISYSNQFSNFDTVYAFCKRGRGRRYSPTLLIKGLVMQLLETHALVVMKRPGRFSKTRFSEVGTKTSPNSGNLAWQLLEDILRLIETAPESQGRVVLIVIDRLDLCVSEIGFSVLEHLIPRLQSLSFRISRVQVLITSAKFSPYAIPTLRRGSEWLQAYGRKIHRITT
ncbi:hypothetical protein F5Y00DRAFT_266875 [Daldinia vernicosa]|uniref:uncharacterized protein n=1 Tax=Daldinia vernicosa TaxID=114800 RepID=UPI00200784B9|nr:uncharacterized protein F5Y00DRAFT_266875 [Daldinia vernicosa]KAI0844147.1 hypothetical protein F5Y00DRAFT_266875 [Daldinia vernicosa]